MLKFAYDPKIEKEFLKAISKKLRKRYVEAFGKELQEVSLAPESPLIKGVLALTKKIWEEHKKRIYANLTRFYDIEKLPSADLTAYLSRTPLCPYDWDEKLFAIPMFGNHLTRMGMVQHELMHYYFWLLKWPSRLESTGFAREDVDMVKEALTVFLNDESKFEKFVDDKGHKKEAELRRVFWGNRNEIETIEDAVLYARKYFQKEDRGN